MYARLQSFALFLTVQIFLFLIYYQSFQYLYYDDTHDTNRIVLANDSIYINRQFHINSSRQFSFKYIPILHRLKLLDPPIDQFDQLINKSLIFVSAWSSNHHRESHSLCDNLRKYKGIDESKKKLIVYDIGLTTDEINEYRSFCSFAEFRNFNFSLYPSYIRNLKEYRWKPLIIAEILLEYPFIWWVDSSMTITNMNDSMQNVYNTLKSDCNRLKFSLFGENFDYKLRYDV